MQALKENAEKLIDEKVIQSKINTAIDNKTNFVFDAGAGAGKTYALIESLKHIIRIYGEKLSNKKQKILCITYTNAAADKIKSNFGNSDIVKVSTIHERVWELIRLHQDALIIEHTIKLENKLKNIIISFTQSDGEEWLNSGDRAKFSHYFLQKEVKNEFYNSKDHTLSFESILEGFGYTIKKNLARFRSSFKFIYDTNNIEVCLDKINKGEHKEVKYNARFNSDRLHYMLISHDTLLEYGLALCEKYQTLRRIIIDSYPYILIDEYQDTNINVVKLMYELSKESNKSQNILIGYYGDQMQSIYSDGVSNNLNKYHKDLMRVEKKYNRRSRDEITQVSNRLRNDDLFQESIYDENNGGTFSFHELVSQRPHDSSNLVSEFINRELKLSSNEDVHCLVLKNEMLAELSGFKVLYINFKDFFFYNEQAQNLISRDLNKLDSAIRIIYELMDFRALIKKREKTLEDILPKENMPITMFDAQKYVTELDILINDDVHTFEDYLIKIFYLYENGSIIYREKLKELLPSNDLEFSTEGFRLFLNKYLSNSGTVKEENRVLKIDKAISLDLTFYIRWYEFISESSNDHIKFHTYHSTKGLEYKNVVIIMENSFSNNKSFFPDFFKSPNNFDFQERRNLLYVACSRAVFNMRILYLDSIDSFKDEITPFFGEAICFCMTDKLAESGLEHCN
jgi:DNA helicase-2/ATP-dependent DNA helicase PcrA